MPILDVTTTVGCTCDCSYCPQDVLAAAYAKSGGPPSMTLDAFEGLIARTPPSVMIAFAGMAEPWLNRDCTRMVEHAVGIGREAIIFTTGVGMTREDAEILKTIRKPCLTLHLPSAEGYENIPIDEEYLSVISVLFESRRVEHCHCHGELHPALRPVVGKVAPRGTGVARIRGVPLEYTESMTRAGNVCLADAPPRPKKGRLYCARPRQQTLLPNGDLLLCPMDYGMRYVLGNLWERDYLSLLESDTFLAVQRGRNDESTDVICRRCEHALETDLRYSVPRWLRNEVHAASGPRELLAMGPKFIRAGRERLRRRADHGSRNQ